MRTLVDLLVRAGAVRDAAVLLGAVTAALSGAAPYGADLERLRRSEACLRQQLREDDFVSRRAEGRRLGEAHVVDFALQAVRRAAMEPRTRGAHVR